MILETWMGRAGRRFDASGNVPVLSLNQWGNREVGLAVEACEGGKFRNCAT